MMSQPTNDVAAQLEIPQLEQQLQTSVTTGLDTQTAQKRFQTDGANVIESGQHTNRLLDFLQNFTSLMACLLWVSGLIAMVSGTVELGIAIWAVNIINGLFSYWEAHAAKKATDALSKMLPTTVNVLRDGHQQAILVQNVVPGDVVEIQAGDAVPADARVLSAANLQIDESSLTGESVPVAKKSTYQHGDGKFSITNIIYAGTVVTTGTAQAVVLATGMQTEFGKIAHLTESQSSMVSPLTNELNRLTRQLSVIALLIGLGFFILAIFFVHYPVAKAFIFALGMIVAFIPEGLLPTVTLSLARGTQEMAKKHALLKSLNSVETLGETSVICSDKTGTLTQNQMTVTHLWLPAEEFTVTGTGYFNNGQIQFQKEPMKLAQHPDLNRLLDIALLNNDTQVVSEADGKQAPKILGTPTEAGLCIVTAKAGLNLPERQQAAPRLTELPFDSDRKRMTTIQKQTNAPDLIYVKGALSTMLSVCDRILDGNQVRPLTAADQQRLQQANQDYAAQGLRSLAFAYREATDSDQGKYAISTAEQHLIFVGLAVMQDPPRPEIYQAVQKCQNAHIKIIMVTGDSALTAKSIAVKIGIVSDQARVITGEELAQLSDAQLQAAVKNEVIFARVAPADKYRIVSMCQANGEIVASTGDGVNDAPALKRANIGIAMGLNGTDVAKQAADMILTDDNFASIVAAIEVGRTVYKNIQKFLTYIFTSNVGEAFPSLLFLASGGLIPLPLTVMQILTVDLGTDMLPALGLGAEPSEPGVMNQPPRARTAHLLTPGIIWKSFGYYGLLGALISMGGYFFVNWQFGFPQVPLASTGKVYAMATTMTLAAIVFSQIANVLNCRTETTSLFRVGVFSNHRIISGIIFEILLLAFLAYTPGVQSLFGTAPLNGLDWLFLACIPVPLVLLEEARKWFVRRRVARIKN
ncbi:P-type (transporting) HAD superfamily ATPase [Fructilactobacillus florum DSM 22689 = JCM 16035]|uniref:P-type (Transporting) HAD superfamily ATPase n=2 Tax=Fructilactobacillus florum TaxID=640331 RepID=A0A0R2CL08_9LACO|nr:P-type (transporting) HAD superfamily ATPase [Fructilactobacillus florum DSM 22689 = JCM 16035]